MVYRSLAMIAVNDLRFSYKGGQKNAITGLTFEIDPGEVFGFLGPSGAGKFDHSESFDPLAPAISRNRVGVQPESRGLAA